MDTLPSNVTLKDASFGGTCTGTKSGTTGGSTVTYASGATIPQNGSCTITANVTSSVPGTYSNIIGSNALQTDQGNNSQVAAASLLVSGHPTVIKGFIPSSIQPGEVSRLTLILDNPSSNAIQLGVAMVDNLPSGLVVSADPSIIKTCPGDVTAHAGGASFSYGAGQFLPSGSCIISLQVTSANAGTYTNIIPVDALQTDIGNNAAATSAQINVSAPGNPSISKVFSPASIVADFSSQLVITLGNNNLTPQVLETDFTDTLPSGVNVSNPALVGGNCPGAVAALPGSSTVTYANGSSIPVGGCTITANVTASTTGQYTNTIPAGALHTVGGGQKLRLQTRL